MKLTEYAQDLLKMAELYGDHDVAEYRHGHRGIVRSVRAPRLCRVVKRTGEPTVEHAVTSASSLVLARGERLIETDERVYVI